MCLYLPLICTSNEADSRTSMKKKTLYEEKETYRHVFLSGLSDRICRENVATGDRRNGRKNFIFSITFAVIFKSTVHCQSSQKYIKQGFG